MRTAVRVVHPNIRRILRWQHRVRGGLTGGARAPVPHAAAASTMPFSLAAALPPSLLLRVRRRKAGRRASALTDKSNDGRSGLFPKCEFFNCSSGVHPNMSRILRRWHRVRRSLTGGARTSGPYSSRCCCRNALLTCSLGAAVCRRRFLSPPLNQEKEGRQADGRLP